MASAQEYVRIRVKRAGEKKWYLDAGEGVERSVGTGRRVNKRRIIDRDSDSYEEEIIDAETGEVVHQCIQRLREHQGHGSARGWKQAAAGDHAPDEDAPA